MMNLQRASIFIIPFLGLMTSSCFTGIESTKRIEMSKVEKKISAPSPEESMLADIVPLPLGKWKVGKAFLCTDNRLSFLLEPSQLSSELNPKGQHLIFTGVSTKTAPDGSIQAIIKFNIPEKNIDVSYKTGKDIEDALSSLLSSQIPMLTDLDMVAQADSILRGRHLFTLSNLWYDDHDTRIHGLRYVEVVIDSVVPSLSGFPLKTYFSLSSHHDNNYPSSAGMFLNFGYSGFDSRSLPSLFSQSDIRKKYPSISSRIWELIYRGEVAEGMTKTECKLSLGNPSEVLPTHDYSRTIDLWQYPDGVVLRFDDGVLVNYR
ncbi:MAG: hypothetical protein K2N03_07120 [Muribaculaceae bacterium]|nr:hypothetical protein [Muribaculaceae bacterium]